MTTPLQIDAYNRQARTYSHKMGSSSFKSENQWWRQHLPERGKLIFDLGAGTGEPARVLSDSGYRVLAVEPSSSMRAIGRKNAPHDRVHWLADHMPDLTGLYKTGLKADFMLINSVLIHLRPAVIPSVFKRLKPLLKADGRLAILHRHGPAPLGRPMHKVTAEHLLASAKDAGFQIVNDTRVPDQFGRPGVSFAELVFSK